jgi:hypothetical protein
LRFRNGDHLNLFTPDLSKGKQFCDVLRAQHDSARRFRGASATSISRELEKLAELKAKGLISDDEWDRATELFLGKPLNERESAIEKLRDTTRGPSPLCMAARGAGTGGDNYASLCERGSTHRQLSQLHL